MTPEQKAEELVAELRSRWSPSASAIQEDRDFIADAIRQAERDAIERCARVAEECAAMPLGTLATVNGTGPLIAHAIRTLSPDNQADKSKEQT